MCFLFLIQNVDCGYSLELPQIADSSDDSKPYSSSDDYDCGDKTAPMVTALMRT